MRYVNRQISKDENIFFIWFIFLNNVNIASNVATTNEEAMHSVIKLVVFMIIRGKNLMISRLEQKQ